MTREEAIIRIKEFGLYHAIRELPNSGKTVEAFEMAIQALQDAECGDAISREEVLSCLTAQNLKSSKKCDIILEARNRIQSLIPVQPARKKGKWIEAFDYYKCSECGCGSLTNRFNFCPLCGADMRESEE